MINPFFNPVFTLKAIKSYLIDKDRLWRISPHKLKKFQDKNFRKAVKYAYTVPLYHKKYKESNIHPSDIKGIEDLNKLPTISKDDMRKANPEDLYSKNANDNQLWKISSSGSTGKPLSFYRDTFGLLRDLIYGSRGLTFVNIDWNKDRLTGFGPFYSQGRYDYAMKNAIFNNLKFFLSSIDTHQHLPYSHGNIKEKLEKINKYKPDYIIGPPIELQALASLKNKGYGQDIKPKVIVTSGGMLEKYVRKYIQDAFNCRVADMYSSVEMSLGAFECEKGNYHAISDYVYFEFLDENGEPVSSGEPGHITLTRFFGKGTPFIRYTGLDDILTPLYESCPCGLNSQLIKSIDGRRVYQIKSPEGKYITPVFFTRGVDAVMQSFKTNKIFQYQVVQEKLDKIDLLVVIDEDKRDEPPSTDVLFEEIKKEYYKIFGKTFQFEVKEVKKVLGSEKRNKTPPLVVSKLKSSDD